LAEPVNKEYAVIKETETKKYLPKQVSDLIRADGYPSFSMHHHTQLWKSLDAQNVAKGYGVMVAGKMWRWYESWVDEARKRCKDNKAKYGAI
jgi:hypothetical protein